MEKQFVAVRPWGRRGAVATLAAPRSGPASARLQHFAQLCRLGRFQPARRQAFCLALSRFRR